MQKQLNIESRTDQLKVVREFVSEAARVYGFDEEEIGKISLAVDEACTNIIKHSYKFDPKGRISLSVRDSSGAFEVSIVDNGSQFDPDAIVTPDMKEYLENYRSGGLGVFLMRSLMDKVEFDIRPGKANEVRLTKYLHQA